jgi:hypothetical protein
MESVMLDRLQGRLEQEIAEGRIGPERAAELRDVLARAQAAVASDGDDLASRQKRVQAMRGALRIAADFAAAPTWPTPEPAPERHVSPAMGCSQEPSPTPL